MAVDQMTPDEVRAYIDRNSSPVRLTTVGRIYETHSDDTMRRLSAAAFLKLSGYRDNIPAAAYDPSSDSEATDSYRLNT